MISLVQLKCVDGTRRVARVEGNGLRLVSSEFGSIYDLAMAAIKGGDRLEKVIAGSLTKAVIDYDPLYDDRDANWKLLPAFDHPAEPARCLVTGTGLTHRKSAENRQAMHTATAPLSDSMKMYQLGIEGGRPAAGEIGAQPEWFYKGCATILRAHGEPLDVPPFADDGGEESEVAGVYIVDGSGQPWRVGMVQSNEFSDHVMEEKNYLYLAPSKLRTCSIGPELIVDPEFDDVKGSARILRGEKTIWSTGFQTGERKMCHTVANLEHHHFKYDAHRRPGDAHIYFFGTDAFSFGDKVRLEDGDVMEIEMSGFGRPLRNPIRIDRSKQTYQEVRRL